MLLETSLDITADGGVILNNEDFHLVLLLRWRVHGQYHLEQSAAASGRLHQDSTLMLLNDAIAD